MQMDNEQIGSERPRDLAGEIIVSGSIPRAVWFLAWPTAVNTFILSIYNIVNRLFVGRLPYATDALAAVGIGGAALMVQFAVTIGLTTGSAALVSRFLGARQNADADEAGRQSLIMAVVAGALSGIPFLVFSEEIVAMMGARGGVVPLAGVYVYWIAWSSVPLFVYMAVVTLLRSAGDVRSPLYTGTVVVAVNAVFDYLLIFGVGPFPSMGVKGAAVATGISRLVATALTVWFLNRSVLKASLAHFNPHGDFFRRIWRIGWPASIQNLLWTLASAGFLKILASLPGREATVAQAAMTVGLAIEAMAFMPGVAYSMAATPLVGQNLGAGKPERANASAWMATWHAVGIMSLVAAVFLLIPHQLAGVFTSRPDVVRDIVYYLRINAIAEPFLAVNMVLRGALQGAGDVRVPTLFTVIALWIVRLPTAYILAVPMGMGATGAWIAMAISTVLSGLLVAGWFKLGRWRAIRV